MKSVSTAAIIAALAAAPAFAQCGGAKLQSAHDDSMQSGSFQLAQTRGEGRTLREEENRRSGGNGIAPAPGTIKGGGDSADDKSGNTTLKPKSGTVGAGQNQGSPPGTSSGRGSAGAPTTGVDSDNRGTSTATNPDANTGVQGGSGRSDTTKGPKMKNQSGSDGNSGSGGGGNSGGGAGGSGR